MWAPLRLSLLTHNMLTPCRGSSHSQLFSIIRCTIVRKPDVASECLDILKFILLASYCDFSFTDPPKPGSLYRSLRLKLDQPSHHAGHLMVMYFHYHCFAKRVASKPWMSCHSMMWKMGSSYNLCVLYIRFVRFLKETGSLSLVSLSFNLVDEKLTAIECEVQPPSSFAVSLWPWNTLQFPSAIPEHPDHDVEKTGVSDQTILLFYASCNIYPSLSMMASFTLTTTLFLESVSSWRHASNFLRLENLHQSTVTFRRNYSQRFVYILTFMPCECPWTPRIPTSTSRPNHFVINSLP